MKSILTKSIILAVVAAAATASAEPGEQATPPKPAKSEKTAQAVQRAAEKPAKPRSADDALPNRPTAIDPRATHRLEQMGEYLRGQRSFTIHMTTETDYVMDDGQKVRLGAKGEMKVRRPNGLRAELTSERKERQYFFDGKTFTIFSPKTGFYATVDAPGTIAELADTLETQYKLQLPLVDLFRWGTAGVDESQFSSAKYVGATRIGNVDVDQYAFRQPGLDWQIWIQRGAQPLPRKLVLTTTDDPARPEHEIVMDWNLSALHGDTEFAFHPPKDSTKIPIADAQTIRARQNLERRATRSVRR